MLSPVNVKHELRDQQIPVPYACMQVGAHARRVAQLSQCIIWKRPRFTYFTRSAYQCRFILDVHHVEDGSDVGGVSEDAAGVEIHRADGLWIHAEVGKLALGQLVKQRVVGRQGCRIN